MKKIVSILLLFIIMFSFSCTTEVTEDITEITNVEEKFLTYCDIDLFSMECWLVNKGEWQDLYIDKTGGTTSLIKLELVHDGGDITEQAGMSFRQDASHDIYTAYSSYNDKNGEVFMTTNETGHIQYRNEWGAEEARKINITVKLKMY